MRIYPNSFSGTFKLDDGDRFITQLDRITEPTTGDPIPTCKFIGKISDKKFRIRKKFGRMGNRFRPEIVGRISGHELKLSIGVNRSLLIIIGIAYLGIFAAFHDHVFPPFVISAILWTILWYFMGWGFYSLEYKKTKREILDFVSPYCE